MVLRTDECNHVQCERRDPFMFSKTTKRKMVNVKEIENKDVAYVCCILLSSIENCRLKPSIESSR